MIEPRHMQVFIVAAETLNFSTAARKLNLSQPAVSQQIQLLENRFGAKLFNRTGRKLELTEAGYTLLPLARQFVQVSLRTEEMMDAMRGQIVGELVIGCSTTPGKYVLPVLLADFLRLHPRVKVTCSVTSRQTALEMLGKGQVHFAFSSSYEELDQNIEFRKFISDPILFIVPLDHPWAQAEEIDAGELKTARFVMREETSGTYRVVRSALAAHDINIAQLKTVLTLTNSEAIGIAVQQGVGVGFVSQAVYTHVVYGKVKPIRLRGIDPIQHIYICRHMMQSYGGAQNAFWNYTASLNPAALAETGLPLTRLQEQAD